MISQGTNIVYIESGAVGFTPAENGETNAVLTLTGVQAADLVSHSDNERLN